MLLYGIGDGEVAVSTPLGRLGLIVLALAAGTKSLRMLEAAQTTVLPRTVGGRRLAGTRLLRARIVVTLVLGIGLPIVVTLALVAAIEPGWLIVAFALMLALGGWAADAASARRAATLPEGEWRDVAILLDRLCIRADMPVPPVVLIDAPVATAWTSAGRIHLTRALLETLDRNELEAVLAHELAHLAHNDAAVMDIATSPSRILLAGIAVVRDPRRCLTGATFEDVWSVRFWGIFYVPPAFVLAWVSRLTCLGLSRARELTADAAAATLTGRPSALASALMKLGDSRSRVPRRDLRLVEARGALSIVEIDVSRFGRLLHTHPPIAERVDRLEAMEERLQSDG